MCLASDGTGELSLVPQHGNALIVSEKLVDGCPQALFEDPLINVLIFVGSLVVLDRACDLTVTNAVKISDVAGFGKKTIGFILVAFCSSLPALSVSVLASLTGRIDVAIGNALGSNIANTSLILGVCLILLTLKSPKGSRLFAVSAKEETETMYYGLFTGSAIPIVLFYMGNASRILGIVLVAVFGAYTYWLVRRKQGPNVPSEAQPRSGLKKRLSLAFLGGAFVVVASYFLVDSASSIALFMHVDQAVIGGTIVAFGTSVSVLSASVRAVMKGQADVSLGNVVGSIFVNATLILGASMALWASSVDVTILFNVVLFSALTSVFVWFFLSSDWMNWKVGVVLVFMYFLFLVMSFGGYKP